MDDELTAILAKVNIKFPSFKGVSSQDADDHVRRFLALCRTRGLNRPDAFLALFPSTLVSLADKWYSQFGDNHFQEWEDLKIAFCSAFRPGDYQEKALDELENMALKTGETFGELMTRTRALVAKLPQPPGDFIQLDLDAPLSTLTSELTSILHSAALESFPSTMHSSDTSRSGTMPQNRWYDDECRQLYQRLRAQHITGQIFERQMHRQMGTLSRRKRRTFEETQWWDVYHTLQSREPSISWREMRQWTPPTPIDDPAESVAVTFGTGASSGCVVNIGAQVTSVICVEEGVALPTTRVILPFGGEDISRCLLWLEQKLKSWPPVECKPLSNPVDLLLLEQVKERHCCLEDGDHRTCVELHFHAYDNPSQMYRVVLPELNVPPLGLFFPVILAPEEYTPLPRPW
ncbi:hypothetical protein L7F22_032796 [Adiantum nelumboides]|nr:hypothetical protein [Adiantum nelumboides]